MQHTLQKAFEVGGVGIHSGAHVIMRCEPAPANAGIIWRLAGGGELVMGQARAVAAPHATVVTNGVVALSTIEHVMAALWACEIDNCVVTLSAPEAPILDGSALLFALLLQQAGRVACDAPRRFLRPRTELLLHDTKRNGFLRVTPAQPGEFTLAYTALQSVKLDASSEGEGEQVVFEVRSTRDFIENFVWARTTGRLGDLAALHAHNLALGSTFGNTVVFDDSGTALTVPRKKDEHLRHKVLDLCGDLFLLGKPLAAKVTAQNTGHDFNRLVLVSYLTDSLQWEEVSE